MHARSVLPIVYIGTLRACQQSRPTHLRAYGPTDARTVLARLTFKVCGPASRSKRVGWVPPFKRTGQWVLLLVYGRYPLQSGLAGAYLYLDVRIKWTKIVIVAHISDWDSLTLTRSVFTGDHEVVMKNVNCARGTCYNWNCNCGTKSRSDTFSDWISSTFA